MINRKLAISMGVALTLTLTACSTFNKVGKSFRNATNMGGENDIPVNDKLVIPPSLRAPATKTASVAPTRSTTQKAIAKAPPIKNFFIVVGTYPKQDQALDTFVRLSSIGLSGATMESRTTKAGKLLHMVRLGPYLKQDVIDSVKDTLTSDGLSQFKVVEN